MSVSGVCQVCGTGSAQFACDRCGAVVCQTHYDPESGFCTECAGEIRGDSDDAGPR